MSFETMSLAHGTMHLGPSLRNRIPILLSLKKLIDPNGDGANLDGLGLDISAGTGAHLEVLAPGFPTLQWTATEFVQSPVDKGGAPSPLDVIDAFCLEAHGNVHPSLPLDLSQDLLNVASHIAGDERTGSTCLLLQRGSYFALVGCRGDLSRREPLVEGGWRFGHLWTVCGKRCLLFGWEPSF